MNFDKLKFALIELTTLEYKYHAPTPDNELEELCKNEQNYIQEFLKRSWIKIVSDAAKLKTVNGRKNKINSFFKSLKPYEERFSDETISFIEIAKNNQPDYSLKPTEKEEKDKLFLAQTENELDRLDELIYNISEYDEGYAYFYRHSYLLSQLMNEEIDVEIVFDITRLIIAEFQYQKAVRFLSVKYRLNRAYAKELYITALSIATAYSHLKEYENNSNGYTQYLISTCKMPCHECQKHKNKIYNICEAKIGVNFPPFCTHNCSTTTIYIDGITKIYN